MSVYEMQGQILHLRRHVGSSTRWRGAELARLSPEIARKVNDWLTELGGLKTLFLRTNPSPWTGAKLEDGTAVEQAFDLVDCLRLKTLPSFVSSANIVRTETGLHCGDSLGNVAAHAQLLEQVTATLSNYSAQIYSEDLKALRRDLEPARQGGFAHLWAICTNGSFRRARKGCLSLRKQKAPTSQILEEVSAADAELKAWKAETEGSGSPQPLDNPEEHIRNYRGFAEDLGRLTSTLSPDHAAVSSINEASTLLEGLAADQQTPGQIPKLRLIERSIENAGAGKLMEEIRATGSEADRWPATFQHAWLSSALDAACQTDPELRGFVGATHSRYAVEFAQLDENRIEITADRVRRAHGERAIQAMNANRAGEQLIRSEANKSRRHRPLRKVFQEAADVLTAVCPCWMASPLSVSQLLDNSRKYFDFVIFDEASQVLPEDAIAAILRGERIVVAGDSKQLPPTTFFASGGDDDYESDEEATATEGFEILLDSMNGFLSGSYLEWHYRSRDESLINFSNHHIYQNRLVTFPGPGGSPAVSHVLVSQELGVDGQEESATKEVKRVVDLVLEHAAAHPDQTLGVITMGVRHMDRIRAALDQALDAHPELGSFFDPSRRERFFVKNLERVQGDERDAVIISIGYGKDRSGKLPLRFGPLIPEGGRRRLNVAITRARRKLVVVSSFNHLDVDLARVRPGSGVELLRDYLQFVASNGQRLGDTQLTNEPLNAFESEVFDCLSGIGMKLIPQMGASRFRIDMVAEHPKSPGRYVLAIECDGASYHSSYTARDRDRLRQQQLESLGWRFHRIWSTDWFLRKQEEIRRAQSAFEEAVRFADHNDQGLIPEAVVQQTRVQHTSVLKEREPRPVMPERESINQYTRLELLTLLKWIESDGQLRSDDEIIEEMVAALGFRRRGARIDATIRESLGLWRRLNVPRPAKD